LLIITVSTTPRLKKKPGPYDIPEQPH